MGTLDRVRRLVVGAGLAAAGWYFALPLWAATAMSVFGAMWFLTGVLSKCSIYYALGYSTRPGERPTLSREGVVKTVSVSKRIRVPVQVAWEILRTGANMDRWVPAITHCELEGDGVGAKRVCVVDNHELHESIETSTN